MQLQQTADPTRTKRIHNYMVYRNWSIHLPNQAHATADIAGFKNAVDEKMARVAKKKKIVRLLKTGITAKAISTAQRLFAQ